MAEDAEEEAPLPQHYSHRHHLAKARPKTAPFLTFHIGLYRAKRQIKHSDITNTQGISIKACKNINRKIRVSINALTENLKMSIPSAAAALGACLTESSISRAAMKPTLPMCSV